VSQKVRYLKGHQSGGQILALPAKRTKKHPIQLLVGHGDTVWPLGTLRKMPFRQEDGKLYGPGIDA
jgi:glutamate carboxypeptidase